MPEPLLQGALQEVMLCQTCSLFVVAGQGVVVGEGDGVALA